MHVGRGPAQRQRRRSRRRKISASLAVILLVTVCPAWFLYPPREAPVLSDAVLVMAGASDGRHELGAQLVEKGISQNFGVSNPLGARDKVGFAHCRGKNRPDSAVQAWCIRSEPVTTVGEVMTMGELAQDEGWATITVVTNRPHTRRVRTMFEQCTNLDTVVVSVENVNMTRIPYLVTREIAGYIKFWLTSPCQDLP